MSRLRRACRLELAMDGHAGICVYTECGGRGNERGEERR